MRSLMASLVLVIVVCVLLLYRKHQRFPLPPGPPPLPLVGNYYQIPGTNPWRTFRDWHQKYGPVISVKAGSNVSIILGTHRAARDLLEKRSNIYSSRPHMVLVGDYIYGGYQTALLRYGAQWRIHRRIHSAFVNIRTTQRYRILQDIESKKLLHDMLYSNDFSTNFRRYSASLLFVLTYGKRLMGDDNSDAIEIREIMQVVLHEAGCNSIAEAFPILNSLPQILAPWKRRGKRLYERQVQLFTKLMDSALQSKSWNWCKEALKMKVAHEVGKVELAFILGTLYEAAHSTQMVMEVFVLASVLHQEAVCLAQEELDRVVGEDRLPMFDDIPDLPYVDAFIREVLRWRPITPAGMPHSVDRDDKYMGYHIPKGATVSANHWSLDFDESIFECPYEFQPQRWLNNPNLPSIAFGFGRRVCPGKHIGRSSLFLNISRVLWAYHIDFAYENGMKIEIDPWNMTQGADSKPMPFQVSFQPRSPKHQKIMEQEHAASEKNIDTILDRIGSNFS